MSTEDPEKEFVELNIKIGESEKLRDEEFLNAVLADELIFRRANGEVSNKEKYLRDLRNPNNRYEYLKSEDVKPTVYEGVAVVSLKVQAKGQREVMQENGEQKIVSFEGTFRNIRIFLSSERNGKTLLTNQHWQWRCVVWFNIRIV